MAASSLPAAPSLRFAATDGKGRIASVGSLGLACSIPDNNKDAALHPINERIVHPAAIYFMRTRFLILVSACVLVLVLGLWHLRARRIFSQSTGSADATNRISRATNIPPTRESTVTAVYAHNLLLRKGADFRIYVPWLRGEMVRTQRNINPTFDDPESFLLDVKAGVIRANIGDIGNFLNLGDVQGSPLRNVKLVADGDQIKLNGTLHKLISMPIELLGSVMATTDNRIQVHVTKLSVLRIPLKGLLGGLHVSVSDLFQAKGITGVEVSGNDILLDTLRLLPPPHIRGQLTRVRVLSPDIEAVYGNAEEAVTRVEQWRNFLRLNDGTIDFGKLTMRHVDITTVDLSDDPWFDLDLNNYQNQLVNGYTRMTAEAGLQIFMPDLDTLPKNKSAQNINMEWLRHRNLPPPPDVTAK